MNSLNTADTLLPVCVLVDYSEGEQSFRAHMYGYSYIVSVRNLVGVVVLSISCLIGQLHPRTTSITVLMFCVLCTMSSLACMIGCVRFNARTYQYIRGRLQRRTGIAVIVTVVVHSLYCSSSCTMNLYLGYETTMNYSYTFMTTTSFLVYCCRRTITGLTVSTRFRGVSQVCVHLSM